VGEKDGAEVTTTIRLEVGLEPATQYLQLYEHIRTTRDAPTSSPLNYGTHTASGNPAGELQRQPQDKSGLALHLEQYGAFAFWNHR
jgi:hypothetical protein